MRQNDVDRGGSMRVARQLDRSSAPEAAGKLPRSSPLALAYARFGQVGPFCATADVSPRALPFVAIAAAPSRAASRRLLRLVSIPASNRASALLEYANLQIIRTPRKPLKTNHRRISNRHTIYLHCRLEILRSRINSLFAIESKTNPPLSRIAPSCPFVSVVTYSTPLLHSAR